MKQKIRWFGVMFFLMLGVVGCGILSKLTEPSAYYHYSGYYGCNWTSEGKIIASKQVYTEEEYGTDNPRYGVHYIVEIDPMNPSSDTVIVSENVWDRNNVNKPIIVWAGENVLAGYDHGNSQAMVLAQYNLNSDVFSTKLKFFIDKLYKNERPLLDLPDSLPDGPDGKGVLNYNQTRDKVLLSVGNQAFGVYSVLGDVICEKSIGGYAVWKDVKTVLFFRKEDQKLASYDIESNSVTGYPVSFRAEYYNASENAAYCIKNGYLKKCDLTSFEVTTIKKLNIDFETLNDYYFSPDGKHLLLTNYLRFSLSTRDTKTPIYTYNLQTDVLTKIRD